MQREKAPATHSHKRAQRERESERERRWLHFGAEQVFGNPTGLLLHCFGAGAEKRVCEKDACCAVRLPLEAEAEAAAEEEEAQLLAPQTFCGFFLSNATLEPKRSA